MTYHRSNNTTAHVTPSMMIKSNDYVSILYNRGNLSVFVNGVCFGENIFSNLNRYQELYPAVYLFCEDDCVNICKLPHILLVKILEHPAYTQEWSGIKLNTTLPYVQSIITLQSRQWNLGYHSLTTWVLAFLAEQVTPFSFRIRKNPQPSCCFVWDIHPRALFLSSSQRTLFFVRIEGVQYIDTGLILNIYMYLI
jgi:hypothetical protein